MKIYFTKTALAVFVFVVACFLSCTDFTPLKFSGDEEISSSSLTSGSSSSVSSSGTETDNTSSSSSSAGSSSSSDNVSSSSSVASSSSALKECDVVLNPDDFFCYDGDVYPTCNKMSYDPSTQYCNGNYAVPAKCNNVPYNPLTQDCCNNNAIYSKSTQKRCENNIVETKCGEKWYDETNTNLYCQNDILKSKCVDDRTTREHYGKIKSQFCDWRDGKTYVYVSIGTQTWMAENLNYDTQSNGSKCGNNDYKLTTANTAFCDTYGRLYNWETAMAVCPEGWHLPSDAEWDALITAVGGSSTTTGKSGKNLKAQSGWDNCGPSGSGKSFVCDDTYGFSALSYGQGDYNNFYDYVGTVGLWWSASEYYSSYAYYRNIGHSLEYVIRDNTDKRYLFSVRCLQDE